MLSTQEVPTQEVEGQQAVVADAPFSSLSTRMHQMFPALTCAEIDRLRRFGEIGQWKAGELLFETGRTGPGMFVLLEGRVKVYQRDGIGREVLIGEHGAGHFLAEVGQLSGRPALVNGLALSSVQALLIPPTGLRALLVAEAELGERIMRALILRRVSLIEKGAGGPILIGNSSDARLVMLQGFLSRNGHPHSVIDERDEDALRLIEQFAAQREDMPLVICPDGTVLRHPSMPELATCLGLLPDLDDSHVYDVAIVGAGPGGTGDRGLCGIRGPVGDRAGQPRAGRPGGRQLADRKLSGLSDRHLRPGAGGPRVRAGAEVRRARRDSGST